MGIRSTDPQSECVFLCVFFLDDGFSLQKVRWADGAFASESCGGGRASARSTSAPKCDASQHSHSFSEKGVRRLKLSSSAREARSARATDGNPNAKKAPKKGPEFSLKNHYHFRNLESTGVVVLWWSARGARGSIQRATLWGAKWSPGMTRNGAKNRSRAVEKIVPEGHKKVGPKGAKKVDQKVHKKVYQKVPKKVNREDRRGPSEWLPGPSAVVWKSHYEWPSGRSQNSIGRVIKS